MECLQKLRERFNQTMKNVMFEDNRNIGKIDQSLYLLGSGIFSDFERFARQNIGYMDIKEMRPYTEYFLKQVEQERLQMQTSYSHYNLTHVREIQFQSLFDSVKTSLYDELQPVRHAINNNPKSKTCWIDGKPIICKMVESVGDKVDEILKSESRSFRNDFEALSDKIERYARIVESSYERCRDEDVSLIKKCGWALVSSKFLWFLMTTHSCIAAATKHRILYNRNHISFDPTSTTV